MYEFINNLGKYILSSDIANSDYIENKLIDFYQFLNFYIQFLVKSFIIFLETCQEYVMWWFTLETFYVFIIIIFFAWKITHLLLTWLIPTYSSKLSSRTSRKDGIKEWYSKSLFHELIEFAKMGKISGEPSFNTEIRARCKPSAE